MLEKTFEIFLSGLIVPILLEVWKGVRKWYLQKRRTRGVDRIHQLPDDAAGAPVRSRTNGRSSLGASRKNRIALRIFFAWIFGFGLGHEIEAMIAVFTGYHVPPFAPLDWVVTIGSVILVWQLLARYSALASRREDA